MPRQIFADEIERFLQGLDGVSSARVLTGPGGDVSYVYVTTESALDSRGLRHGVVAALQSRFGIPVDEWRVRVTQLRAGVQPAEIPRFRVMRVEETATAADLAVTVKLQWTRGSDVRSATGQSRGRGGGGNRPRALAAATLAAVREALDVSHADLALERVGTVTFLDRPVVLVALSMGLQARGAPSAPEAQTFVGTAFEDTAPPAADETAEPAITATLDAVTRWLLHAVSAPEPVQSMHRRERLEAIRHFLLDSAPADPPAADVPVPANAQPAPGRPAEPIPLRPEYEEAAAAEAGGATGHGGISRIAPVRPLARHLEPLRDGHNRVDTPGGGRSGSQIPPRETARPGAAMQAPRTREEPAMTLQHDTPDVSVRATRGSGLEDGFYRSLIADRTPVHLRCRDGYEVPRAIVRDAGTYALLVETPDGLELFFKHAIISIRVLSKAAAQA
ncbi:MAG TPA: hypothetical protein VFL28_02305 [bacterium]|nr:hypothetical protein [bacterium]